MGSLGAIIGRTIAVGKNDFVIIVRRWRQRGPVRRGDAWKPAGVVDDAELARTMVELLMSADTLVEARALSYEGLLRELRAEDRERIFEELNNRTTGDAVRADALRAAALARGPGRERVALERRSGRDRRSGQERRQAVVERSSAGGGYGVGGERRGSRDRRSRRERRDAATAT